MNFGEEIYLEDKSIFRILTSICGDTNYKIRTDGATFLKKYFAKFH